ncbi:MAG: DUF2752 domain-containing protein [Acidobacteria bacterium]|nr:DUF2752 domain-containing protein [Acidobacteriota bacterium]MCA1636836.1 DUF2752 domain-containing protein [Acidobacteriota bacterium]
MSEKSSNTKRVFAATGILAAITGAFVVHYFNPTTAKFFPVCPLYAMTGIACPGCGLTRGFHALFHGDILDALHFNALLPVYTFIFGYIFLSMFLVAARGRGLSFKAFPPFALWGLLIVSIIFTIVRNLPFYPFNLLAI